MTTATKPPSPKLRRLKRLRPLNVRKIQPKKHIPKNQPKKNPQRNQPKKSQPRNPNKKLLIHYKLLPKQPETIRQKHTLSPEKLAKLFS